MQTVTSRTPCARQHCFVQCLLLKDEPKKSEADFTAEACMTLDMVKQLTPPAVWQFKDKQTKKNVFLILLKFAYIAFCWLLYKAKSFF